MHLANKTCHMKTCQKTCSSVTGFYRKRQEVKIVLLERLWSFLVFKIQEFCDFSWNATRCVSPHPTPKPGDSTRNSFILANHVNHNMWRKVASYLTKFRLITILYMKAYLLQLDSTLCVRGVSKKSRPFQIQISHHVLYYLTTLILQVWRLFNLNIFLWVILSHE